jgi:hypothetical protein
LARGKTTENSALNTQQGRDFSPLLSVDNGSGTRIASYPVITSIFSKRATRYKHEAGYSDPHNTEVKMQAFMPSLLRMSTCRGENLNAGTNSTFTSLMDLHAEKPDTLL